MTFRNSKLNDAMMELSEDARKAVSKAIARSGKRKGLLLKNPPSRYDEPMGYAAWMGLIRTLAPVRLSIWGMLCMGEKPRDIFDEVAEWSKKYSRPLNLSAQNPFEFNTFHFYEG